MRFHHLILGALAPMTLLAGCGMVAPEPVEPNSLALWAAEHGELVGDPPPAQQGQGDAMRVTDDRHGYQMDPGKGGGELRIYFVPLASVDEDLPARINENWFPGGNAVLAQTVGDGENPPHRRLPLGDVESYYLMIAVGKNAAMCADYTVACDSVVFYQLLGKLKRHPLFGAGQQSVAFGAPGSEGYDALIGDDAPSAAALCGFDPEADRIPAQVRDGCMAQRLMRFAVDNGFTLDKWQALMPLDHGALVRLLDFWVDQPLASDGVLPGSAIRESL
ncbi:hypothetical protein [Stakelama tenebrarum]|uniref:Uncharacterized protein n=1 Tax=Stakelama tenebrarum TaxID=2711215 RepID=A0A6G6Y1S7_9SPHN|nr:hypothetical protein [Sphingosinithalassobacter tenebrarum]QIG78791.1 hypothetical protein G5C33_02625 [Sphingosinithalassobacter tenebrarum]